MLTMNTHCKLQLCLNTFCCTNICTHIYLLYSILFLDSLKMHSKNTYARHIRGWLNCEWKRLGHGKKPIFDTESLPLVSPRSRFLSPFPLDNMSCRIFSFFLFFANNDITHSSTIPRQWMRLWRFRLQVCLQFVHDEAPKIYAHGLRRKASIHV